MLWDTNSVAVSGKVRVPNMKFHTVLKALVRQQAHRSDLRIYVQITYSERGKLITWRFYHLRSGCNGKCR